MARDLKDSKTIDPFGVKKRGRPSTGTALTAAQRMAAKRERDRQAINESRTLTDYRKLTTVQLIAAMSDVVALGSVKTAKIIAGVLVERAQFNFNNVE